MTLAAQVRSNPRLQVSAAAVTALATSISASHSYVGAVNVTLDGSAVVTNAVIPGTSAPFGRPGQFNQAGALVLSPSNGLPTLGSAAVLPVAQNVLIASAGNDSGITFTITGYDRNGNLISEVLAGANTATATSALLYTQVNSIKTSGSTAAAITVGTGATIFSPWLILSHQRANYTAQLRMFFNAGGTGTYDVQATSDPNLLEQIGDFADDLATLVTGQTTAQQILLPQPWEAVRLRVTATGPVFMRALMSTTA